MRRSGISPSPLTICELVPVRLAEVVLGPLLVPHEIGIRDGQAEQICLRNGGVDELLAEFVVGVALDPHAIERAVLGESVGRAEHHDARPPPPIEGPLAIAFCSGVPREGEHDLKALALMEAPLADPNHRPPVGP